MAEVGEQLTFDFMDAYSFDPVPAVASVPDLPFPEEAANALAAKEAFNKHLYRPNTYLHKWWARRCGTTFRFILKQFVPDPVRRDFYAPGGLDGITVLDPMMGGGTTLHEAIRMGANVIGADIDPIPVLQARATLTYIPESQVRATFQRFLDALRTRLASYYSTCCPFCGRDDAEIKFTLYALCRRCDCGEALLVNSYTLRREANRTIRLCPECRVIFDRDHICASSAHDPRSLREKAMRVCPTCGQRYADLTEVPFRQRYVPLVVVGECPGHGQFFKSVDLDDLERLSEAEAKFGTLDFGGREQFTVSPGPKSKDLLGRGIYHYLDLFSARQLAYIEASLQQLQAVDNHKERLLLALLVSTSLEFNSMLCSYKGGDKRRPGAIRHTFSHHAYSFPYTAAENNPLFPGGGSGTLVSLFERRVIRARRWAARPVERRIEDGRVRKVAITGEKDFGYEVADPAELQSGTRKFWLRQGDSRHLPLDDDSVDYVVTDPPYYDSVQYSDLAAFFRVWLRLFVPRDVQWDYEISASAVDEGGQSEPGKYLDILGGIFCECRRVLKPSYGRMVFTFHHWDPRAWAELTLALKRADFHLASCYVVHSENPISVHIRTLRAIKHDCILVLAPGSGGTKWERPERVDDSDSYNFCADCGIVLGWLLDSDYSEDEIVAHWMDLLKR